MLFLLNFTSLSTTLFFLFSHILLPPLSAPQCLFSFFKYFTFIISYFFLVHSPSPSHTNLPSVSALNVCIVNILFDKTLLFFILFLFQPLFLMHTSISNTFLAYLSLSTPQSFSFLLYLTSMLVYFLMIPSFFV